MNAISGPASTTAALQLWTTGAIRPVRRVTSNAERVAMPAADSFERSTPAPAVTYGRSGQMDRDGDGDRS